MVDVGAKVRLGYLDSENNLMAAKWCNDANGADDGGGGLSNNISRLSPILPQLYLPFILY